jgi:PAS domain S-box-containing protein
MKKNVILVIDDDQNLSKTLFDILNAKGYETFVAGDGTEGLAFLQENPVDLVLTDLGLPDMSGIDILGKVKTIYPAIQVIILTGNATVASAVEATNLGAFSYLLKPYDINQLLLQIQRALEKQRADEDLRISRQLLVDVTRGIKENILLIANDHKILWANRAALVHAGLTMNEIVGQYCYTVNHYRQSPCEPPDEPCPLHELLKSGVSKTAQQVHIGKDGNKEIFEVIIYPVKDNAGEMTGLVHISRDITERARLEQEIADKVTELEASLARVKQLEGILSICMYCKKIRDEGNNWRQMEEYISQHSEADFSHGLCPECFQQQMKEFKAMREE